MFLIVALPVLAAGTQVSTDRPVATYFYKPFYRNSLNNCGYPGGVVYPCYVGSSAAAVGQAVCSSAPKTAFAFILLDAGNQGPTGQGGQIYCTHEEQGVIFSGESAIKECNAVPPLGQPLYPQGQGWQEGEADGPPDGGRIGGYFSATCRVSKRECPAGYNASGASCTPTGAKVAAKMRGTPAQCCTNPIEPGSGNKYQREIDYRGPGVFALELARTYNSAVVDAYRSSTPSLTSQWSHSYEREIRLDTNTATLSRQDGKTFFFVLSGGAWLHDDDVSDKLERLTDTGGNPTGWRYTTADGDLVETYNAAGKLLSIANRAGLVQTLTYSTASTPSAIAPAPDMLISVADPFGRTLSIAYDDSRRIKLVTDPAGGQYVYTYDDVANNLASVTYPGGETRTYHYEDPNFARALTGITDETGQRFATYGYESQGRANLSEHAGGADHTTLAYNPDGSAVVTEALGATRTYAFQSVLGVLRYTAMSGSPCPSCGSAAQAFDANGNAASRTDWNGNATTYQHDLARNLETSRTEASGTQEVRSIATEWHPSFRLPTRITEPKRETALSYDSAKGTLLARTVRDTTTNVSRTWTYTYNANGQVLTVDGPRTDVSDVTTYSYYPNDDPDIGKRANIATITNALGQVTQITAYNAHGQPLTITDPNGLVTSLTYDARQRLTSRSVGVETTTYDYDGVGQVTKVTLPDGSFRSYTYDAAHRLTAIADNLGNRIAYTLDAMGNRTREDVSDPANQLAQTRSRVYSNLNRLDQEIGGTNPAAQITRFAYDNQGNVTAITDPLNRVTANAYDALNRLKQMTDPASGVTRYGYDGLDQLISVTDPRNNATTYTLDGLGNLTQQLSPDTGATGNTPDAAGNLLTSTDAKGQTTAYTYDALNRVGRIVYNQASGSQLKQVDYGYDQGANAIGRLSSITETSAAGSVLQTASYSYDPKGRVLSEARTISGATYTTSYAYDGAGRMTGMTYPSGRTLAYGLDGLGRVNRIETTGSGTTQVVVQDVVYQPFGPAKAFTFGNLQSFGRAFDLDGRITVQSLADQTKALSFDAASRITRIEQQGVPTNYANYGYDALDRLTNAVLPTSNYTYGYDAVGNRLSKSAGASTDTYSYPATSNRLAAIAGATLRSYAADANGSVTADGVNTFGDDARGRLVTSTSAVGNTNYQVNALGQRVRKISTLGDTVYHYDTQGRLVAESSASGSPIREYLYLGDQPVAVAAYAQAGASCPTNPTLDTSNTFAAFNNLERLEVRSGRLGAGDWEWGLGNNTQQSGQFTTANLDWVNNVAHPFTLTYDGAGSATVTVRNGANVLFTKTWATGMDAGNATKLYVKATAGIGAGNRITLAVTSIDGQVVADTLQTTGDGNFSEVARVYAGTSLANGFTVEGTVSMTFTGSYPPQGSRLNMTVTAGNVQCQQAGPSTATLYYVNADHLNTPRAVTNQQQQLVWRWENTEPFGNSLPEDNPSGLGSFEFPLRFPGTYADRETGLFYNYFRDYDPQTGRYVQSDPIGLGGGINPYLYGRANPLRFTDPRGLEYEPADPGAPAPWLFGIYVHNAFSAYAEGLGLGANRQHGVGTGRPDAFDPSGGFVWELKPRSYQSGYKYAAAAAQVGGYCGATPSGAAYRPGHANQILRGQPNVNLTVNYLGTNYDVTIFADPKGAETGLLFYDYSPASGGGGRSTAQDPFGSRSPATGPVPPISPPIIPIP
ncbi:MAG TPA: RHS repeat-associated core domain-containing protein [Burkholderiales bacterium]|nr:RHS repeat-associated core domain-containing protein [Burkholderiales bacterium]